MKSQYGTQFQFFYTDGSGLEGFAGVGVYHPNCCSTRVKIKNGTVFEAEMTAISHAIRHIKANHEIAQFCIVSDSMTSLKCIASMTHPSKLPLLALQIRSEMIDLRQKGYTISLVWVPSHTGIAGNEVADSIAKAAFTALQISTTNSCYIRRTLQEQLIERWQENWTNCIKGRRCFQLFPTVSQSPWIKADTSQINRQRYRITNRIFTGHTRTNEHLFRIGVSESDLCGCRTAIQTVDHLIRDCPELDHKEIIDVLRGQGISFPCTTASILRNEMHTCGEAIFKLIFNNNLVI